MFICLLGDMVDCHKFSQIVYFMARILFFLLYTINRKLVPLFEAELGGMCLSMWDMNMFLCQCYLLFTSC